MRPSKAAFSLILDWRILMGMSVNMNVYTDMSNETNQIGYTNAYVKLIPFSAF
jgi:hypothetical protein